MKRTYSYLLTPISYIYYFLNPRGIIHVLHNAYFNSFSRKAAGGDLRLNDLFSTNIHLSIVGILLAVGMYLLLPFVGRSFHTAVAIRVFGGFIAAFLAYAVPGALLARIRAFDKEKKDGRFASAVLFFCIPGALAGSLLSGITGDLTLGVIVAGAETALIPMAFSQMPSASAVTFGCLFGALVSVIALPLSRFNTPVSAWLPEFGAALLTALALFFILLLLILVLNRALRGRPPSTDYAFLFGSMLFTPAWLSFGFSQFAETIHAPRPSQLGIAFVYIVIIFRIPLWPLEVLWARLRFRPLLEGATRFNEQPGMAIVHVNDIDRRTRPYRRAFRAAFFDRRTPLLLAGEPEALLALAQVDSELACEEAIELLRFSPRRHTAHLAMVRIAQQDPVGAFPAIWELQRWDKELRWVPAWVGSSLRETPALLWRALVALQAIEAPVEQLEQSEFKPQGPPAQQQFLFSQANQTFLVQARERLASALELVEEAARAPTPPRGVQFMRSILQQAVRELNNEDAFAIAPLIIDQELLLEFANQIYDKQYYHWAIERTNNEAWIARSMTRAATLHSVTQKQAYLLKVMSEGGLSGFPWIRDFKHLFREKAPALWIPERCLDALKTHWRRLIVTAAQHLANQQPEGPIESPFVLGRPVRGTLFMGREGLMDQLKSLWGEQPQWQSILLHGHRRMGKSSILHNLHELLRERKVAVASLSVQELGEISGAAEFLRPLARKILRAAKSTFAEVSESSIELFDKYKPYEAFSEIIEQIGSKRGLYRLLIAIDEYEDIDAMLENGNLEATLLKYLRSLMDNHVWLSFAFAGLHTHNELYQEHWQQLFRTVLPIRVSFLSQEDAQQLLTQPTDDFPVSYEAPVLQRAWELTAGQPFLLQLLGYSLLERLNQSRRHRPKAPLLIEESDLEATLDDSEFYQRGAPYFEGVMRQVSDDQLGATKLLHALCQGPDGFDPPSLMVAAQLDPMKFEDTLALLLRHEVVRKRNDGRIVFAVELMRMYCMRPETPSKPG